MGYCKGAVVGAVASVFVWGCGGGSGSGGTSASTTLKIGETSVTYEGGAAKPFVQAGQNTVTVTGMAGASYSNIGLVPNQNLDNSLILLTAGGPLITETLGGVQESIEPAGIIPLYGVFTHDRHIAFNALESSSGNIYLYECNYDGTNVQKVLATPLENNAAFAWAPNDEKIAWVDTSANLWVSNPNGSSPVLIAAGGTFPSFSPDSSKVIFLQNVGGYTQIYTEPATGGSPTLFPGLSSTTNYEYPGFMPDGTNIMYTVVGSGTTTVSFSSPTYGFLKDLVVSGNDTDQEESTFGPDGQSVVFLNGDVPTIAQFDGNDPVALPDPGMVGYPQWSPYYSSQTFVGNGGSMYISAEGFLWGQQGDGFSSFVTFAASNPSSSTITSETSSGTGALIFDVHASAISSLKYTNGYYNQVYGVFPTGTVTDMLVSFDSTTGQVETIAPFVAARTAMKPSEQGSTALFQAKFTGVYTAKGSNVAPSGASQLELDEKSGRVVRVQ